MPANIANDAQLLTLLAAIAQKDKAAFYQFYQATVQKAFGIAQVFCHNFADAEEVVIESFWQVWQQAGQFDRQRGSPRAWLSMIVRSQAIDRWRQLLRWQVHYDAALAEEAASECPEPADLLACFEKNAAVAQALQTLDATDRQLLAWCFFHDASHAQIAKYTRMPLGTVKARIRRSLQKLHALLKNI